jgi:uncharacterized protein (TIGR03083 family)
VSEWNYMHAESKDNLLRTVRQEAAGFFELVTEPGVWEDPTAAGHWQVRDHVGHMVDTTEGYFVSFDAARGQGEPPENLGVRHMAGYVDEGARRFRDVPRQELLDRLQADFDKFQQILGALTDEEWTGLMVPHKYMGPLPAGWYGVFQLVDYGVHSWDIRQGKGRGHGLDGDAADLLVPFALILWQSTAEVEPGTEPFDVGIRITGRNGGDTLGHVTADGLTLAPGSIDDVPLLLEFDPSTFVLTAYGRFNGGTIRGDRSLSNRFLNLFYRI